MSASDADGGRAALQRLAEAMLDGDPHAERQLLTRLMPSLLGAVRSVLGRHHPDIEDVLQEALLGVVAGLTRFRGECGVKHYANRIAARCALDIRRRNFRRDRRHRKLEELAVSVEESPRSPHAEASTLERRALVRELLDTLPEAQAEALMLRIVLGFSLREVAEATGAPANTVRSRLRLAKQALARRIEEHPELAEGLEAAG